MRGLKRKIAWKQTSRKLPSWTKHPLIIATYTSFHDNSLVTIKVHARRAYHEVKAHASGLEWTSTMTSTLLFSIYLIFFGLYINWFAIFMQDLQWFAYNGVDSSSWSFGQIVAISVWASPLCEYFHLELRELPCILAFPSLLRKTPLSLIYRRRLKESSTVRYLANETQ